MRRAVVDVGSNSVLLTVAVERDGHWTPELETSKVTALGEGVRETGSIGELGAAATLNELRHAKERAGGAELRAYGTMALRIAQNAQDFLDRAAGQGTPLTVISGEMEAELGLACVLEDPTFANRAGLSVLDVGGHSTEVSTTASRVSFPVGTLGLRSQYLHEESPNSGAVLQASAALDDAFAELGNSQFVVGLGASVTNLASIREGLLEWDASRIHGAYLDYEEVSRFVGRSMRMTDSERGEIVGLEPGRERTVHIGALIVERALLALGAGGIVVSVRGWRHAMLSRWL